MSRRQPADDGPKVERFDASDAAQTLLDGEVAAEKANVKRERSGGCKSSSAC